MTDRELLKMSLDALEKHIHEYEITEAIRARLAQPEEDGFVTIEAKWGKDFVDMLNPDKPGEIARFWHDSNWRMKGSYKEPKPVAWMDDFGFVQSASEVDGTGLRNIPLYTAPPQREWVALTNEEILEAVEESGSVGVIDMARAMEAKIKEKNHG